MIRHGQLASYIWCGKIACTVLGIILLFLNRGVLKSVAKS